MSANDPTWHSVPGCESPAVITSDASSGKHAEEVLRGRHKTLLTQLETTLDCFWRADREGNLLEANPAYIRLSGYTREELLGLGIFDLAAIPGATTIEAHLQRIIGYGSDTFESIQLRKDGSTWLAEVNAAFLDIGGSGEFFAFLRDISGRKRIEPPAVSINAEAVIRECHCGSRILVVDDQALNREVARMLLETTGLVVDTAEDGAVAIAMAWQAHYAVILMDMQMPNIDGLDATRQIREIPGYRQTPIIAMTANASAEAKTSCFEAGMTDFMTKPLDADLFFAMLLRSLNQCDPPRMSD